MPSPIDPALQDDVKSTSMMSWSVIAAIGELLAAASETCDGDASCRVDGHDLYRRLVSVIAVFLTAAIVLRVCLRASVAGRRFVYIAGKAQRHLSRPPAAWAAP